MKMKIIGWRAKVEDRQEWNTIVGTDQDPPRVLESIEEECCVLSGTGLCDELITRAEESYRLWCVVVCDLETS